ncbi:MAG: hypothetical protein IPO15_26940 [Anaerolineae bacterium]|uniref:hypothetical protein n=1 Tax=Candidatus Amarolinea dominans TaxID=3140696 RepID=UPI003134AFB9|nr:hypothetical protein [Anaerolineae bacterium]
MPVISYDEQSNQFLIIWHDHRYRMGMTPPRPPETAKEIFGQWLGYLSAPCAWKMAATSWSPRTARRRTIRPRYQQYATMACHAGQHYLF